MNISDFIVSNTCSIVQAMEQIDKAAYGILFICDEKQALCGCITDGDIRRYILHGGDLSQPVLQAANVKPKYCMEENAAKKSDFKNLKCVPILNSDMQIISLRFSDAIIRPKSTLHMPVVIMAGGKGTRLKPYTDVLPKPLIPIGNCTITEHIIDQFLQFDCNEFFMIVNHGKALIKAYFGELIKPYDITFVDEEQPLGTGGGLSLLTDLVFTTFILSNCDILIDSDYAKAVAYHKKQGNMITLVCAAKNITIPYGTVKLDDSGKITQLVEKPELSFLTNTGFYIIEPEFLSMIPPHTFIHITEVIQLCMDRGRRVGAYPISQSAWYDMGQMDEMEKMLKWKSEA